MLNRIILMGRLTADPELRTTPSGVSVASFSIAVERNYQQNGERQTDFINCVAWRQTGEFISRFFQKGRMIAVEGSLQTRRYEDKTGAKRTAYDVVVDQAYFADSKSATSESSATPFPTEPPKFEEPERGNSLSVGDFGNFEEIETDDGDLPF